MYQPGELIQVGEWHNKGVLTTATKEKKEKTAQNKSVVSSVPKLFHITNTQFQRRIVSLLLTIKFTYLYDIHTICIHTHKCNKKKM